MALEVVDSVWWKQQLRVKSAGSERHPLSSNRQGIAVAIPRLFARAASPPRPSAEASCALGAKSGVGCSFGGGERMISFSLVMAWVGEGLSRKSRPLMDECTPRRQGHLRRRRFSESKGFALVFQLVNFPINFADVATGPSRVELLPSSQSAGTLSSRPTTICPDSMGHCRCAKKSVVEMKARYPFSIRA